MANPWSHSTVPLLKDVTRFALWLGLAIAGLLCIAFLVYITAGFLWRLAVWLFTNVFSPAW